MPRTEGKFKVYTFDIFGNTIHGAESNLADLQQNPESKFSKSASQPEI